MKVYNHGGRGSGTVFVSPGFHHPETLEWMLDGKPRMFTVKFTAGEARVDSQLGRYMIEHGLAKKSPLILPAGVAA